jgi:hypothetical protein
MQTSLYRSRKLIVESDEADLVQDVSFDIDKAQTKLAAIRNQLQGVREQSAAQIENAVAGGNQAGRGDRCGSAVGAKMKRRRRSHRKRNRQRLAARARRLRR